MTNRDASASARTARRTRVAGRGSPGWCTTTCVHSQEQPIVTCRAWSSAAWEGGRRFGMVQHGSGHLEATIWCPLTIGRVRRLGRSAPAGGAFDSRASNARARRCNQTCRAADDPMALDLAARRGQLRPQSPKNRQGKSPAARELRGGSHRAANHFFLSFITSLTRAFIHGVE